MQVILGSVGVLLGCCANVYVLEHIIRYDAGAGNLATFCQFFFISVGGICMSARSLCTRPITHIPITAYFALIVTYFLAGATANASFLYDIPMTLMLVFRSGSLVVNMMLGILFLGKRYDAKKYVSVLLVTVGITFCTLGSASQKGHSALSVKSSKESTTAAADAIANLGRVERVMFPFEWAGIGLLVVSVFLTAATGILQESLFGKYGKHPREALFYTHFLPLPAFIFLWKDLFEHGDIANGSEPLLVLGLIAIPMLWGLIAANTILQYACINSVFLLTAESNSLTVTLLLTLRKFLSILISALAFESRFSQMHWIGTGFIFVGTLLYDNPLSMLKAGPSNYRAVVDKGGNVSHRV